MTGILAGIIGSFAPKTPNSYESIATTTVGSGGSSTITFSSISSSYQHLQIRVMARGNNANTYDSFYVRFNSDSGNNYTFRSLQSDGATVSSNSISPYSGLRGTELSGNTATANIFGVAIIDIIDFSSTVKYKTGKVLGGVDRNGTGAVTINSGIWANTAAVNSVTIVPVFGTSFLQYSSFALYGMKG
jgi:hypothetical protein